LSIVSKLVILNIIQSNL